jgi:hypothetical protein
MVLDDFIDCHPAGEEFKEVLAGVPQPADRRLPVTDPWVRCDAIDASHRLPSYSAGQKALSLGEHCQGPMDRMSNASNARR